MQTIPLSKAQNIAKMLEATPVFDRIVISTDDGEVVATILSPGEMEAYEETIFTLSNNETLRALKSAKEDKDSGTTCTHEEVFGS